jgi:hypothetical protein
MGMMMRGPTISDFKRAILQQHGVGSRIVSGEAVAVQGWEGDVLVFALLNHPIASLCYAWHTNRRVTVVLQQPPIDSPRKAVLSALLLSNAERAN